MLWIPPGFAHGFLVLSEPADFLYKTTDYYAPEHERAIAWNDPELAIAWPLAGAPTLSAQGHGRHAVPRRRSLSVRILLTGANGQVGWELRRALAPLGEVVALDRAELDLARPDSLRSAVREIAADR